MEGLSVQFFPGSSGSAGKVGGLDWRSMSLRPCSEIRPCPPASCGPAPSRRFFKVCSGILRSIHLAGRPELERKLGAGEGFDLPLGRFELFRNLQVVGARVELERHERRLLDTHTYAVELERRFRRPQLAETLLTVQLRLIVLRP